MLEESSRQQGEGGGRGDASSFWRELESVISMAEVQRMRASVVPDEFGKGGRA